MSRKEQLISYAETSENEVSRILNIGAGFILLLGMLFAIGIASITPVDANNALCENLYRTNPNGGGDR